MQTSVLNLWSILLSLFPVQLSLLADVHTDIYGFLIALICSLTRLTLFSLLSCLEALRFLSAAPLLVSKSLLTMIWGSDSSGDGTT